MKAFLSYKWESDVANRWVETLACDLRLSGIDVSLDKWEVAYGESFTEYMTSRISKADIVLFVITEAAVRVVENDTGGGAVKFELQLATARRTAGEKFRFIGLLREGDRIPPHLRDYRYVDFRNDANYKQSLAALVKDVFGITDRPPLGAGIRNLAGTQWTGIKDKHWMQLIFHPSGKLQWFWYVDDPAGGDILCIPTRENRWEQHGNIVRCVLNGAIYDGIIDEAVSKSNPLLSSGTKLTLRNERNWATPFEITLTYERDSL